MNRLALTIFLGLIIALGCKPSPTTELAGETITSTSTTGKVTYRAVNNGIEFKFSRSGTSLDVIGGRVNQVTLDDERDGRPASAKIELELSAIRTWDDANKKLGIVSDESFEPGDTVTLEEISFATYCGDKGTLNTAKTICSCGGSSGTKATVAQFKARTTLPAETFCDEESSETSQAPESEETEEGVQEEATQDTDEVSTNTEVDRSVREQQTSRSEDA